MKGSSRFLIGAYGLGGFAVAFLFFFWLIFRWLHWGYTKWLLDSGDWVFFDGSFSILFGLLLAAVPFSARLAYPLGQPVRSRGLLRAVLWFIAAVVFIGPCVWYQHHMETDKRGAAYPDSILAWPVLYYLVGAIAVVLLTGWMVGRRQLSHGGASNAV